MADASGHLLPAGTPGATGPADGETFLLRDLARLVEASSAEIAASASRHGVLHPTSIPSAELEPAIGLMLGDWIQGWRQDLKQLRRWVATGGTAAIPGRLAPAAYLLLRLAQLPDSVQEDVERLVRDGPVAVRDPSRLIAAGWAALGEAASQSAEVMRLRYLEGAEIELRLRPSTPAGKLQRAYEVARSGLEAASGRVGDVAPELPPGWLGGLVAQYGVTPGMENFPFAAPESVDAWRVAAGEAASWRGAIRELRAGARTWACRAPTRLRYLSKLRQAAGLSPSLAEDVQPRTVADRLAYRAELKAILIRRLQQEGAWPRPAAGVPVPTMGRALWSVWMQVTTQRPPRRCAWAACQDELPPEAHGNQRYCETHRTAAARERAARHYARAKARVDR